MDQSREMHECTLAYVEDMAVLYLRHKGRAVPLRETLLYLATICRSDTVVSRALASLQSQDRIELGTDRHLRLTTVHA